LTTATEKAKKDNMTIIPKNIGDEIQFGILTAKPLVIDSKKVLAEKKGSEERLLDLLRSKA